jgi:hypothetical protein
MLRGHWEQQRRCLETWFDVTVIEGDCDYDEICDRFRPDLSMFESGVDARGRKITNSHKQSHIPKIGLLQADAFDSSRQAFIADMLEWGVQTYFTTSTSMAEYTPEISRSLFVWSHFVDQEIFKDYLSPKVIPVLFTGSQAIQYPWRNAVYNAVSQAYPTMLMPHFGWDDSRGSRRMVYGEPYARLINASQFVPVCGTVTRDIVRKHFEVPGARACMIAEPTASLEAAGFKDMVNCVTADPHNVIDKIDLLIGDPERLDRVTEAGFLLVRSRHLIEHRTQIHDWFALQQVIKSGQRIVQRGPFERLEILLEGMPDISGHVSSGGLDRTLISEAWLAMNDGRLAEGETKLNRALNFFQIPEALVALAWCKLLRGSPVQAQNNVGRLLQVSLEHHSSPYPDPVQWAVYVLAALCKGDVKAAVELACRYPTLRHHELDRVRGLLRAITHSESLVDDCTPPERYNATVSPLPEVSNQIWLEHVRQMLNVCGQHKLAVQLSELTEITTAVPRSVPQGEARNPDSHRGLLARCKDVLGQARAGLRFLSSEGRRLLKQFVEDEWSRYVATLVQKEDASALTVIGPPLVRASLAHAANVGCRRSPHLAGISVSQSDRELRHREGLDGILIIRWSIFGARIQSGFLDRAKLLIFEGPARRIPREVRTEVFDSGRFVLLHHSTSRGRERMVFRRSLQSKYLAST